MGSIVLTPNGPFRWHTNLHYLTRSAKECLFEVDEHGTVYRALRIGDELVLVKIGSEDDVSLVVEWFRGNKDEDSDRGKEQTASSDKRIGDAVQAYVREWFDLETNLTSFYDAVSSDPLLTDAIHSHYGLKLIGVPDLFEALCWSILGQQISLSFAYTLKRRFVEKYGDKLWHGNREYLLFPAPETIAAISPEELRELQITTRKSEYLVGIAAKIASGELSKEKIRAVDDLESIERQLVDIRGIGSWTANYTIMRSLRMPNAFPIGDAGLQNAVGRALGWSRKPTLAELAALSERWEGWKAYATFYLWMTL